MKDLERKAELVSKLKTLPRRFGLVARGSRERKGSSIRATWFSTSRICSG
ncbi:hypothetical protein [Pyrococcus horikoshii]|uniref:Uncharacterized protein n=1 Tax=Pyrococcus horikoshii TaxID=53953 RepID=A0A832SZT4_PYRHR|nr:hypothetical protein [Pyrococcus horikoshii]HII61299.1 hypothetical protein [Pyrococcus horikoshii]